MNTVEYDGSTYLELQTNGNAARFALPFAREICEGNGLDIGCNREEWAFPGARMIDLCIDDEFDAFNLPPGNFDYIFSSHCLEHLDDWAGALNVWLESVKEGGVIFLYLPHYSQRYWRPWANRKHVNILDPKYLRDYLDFKDVAQYIVSSGPDLYNSFSCVIKK